MLTLKNQNLKHFINILNTKFILLPLSIAIGVVTSRILGPSDKGVFAFIVVLGNIFIPILTFGIDGGMKYYISSKKFELRDVFFTTIVVGLITGVFSSILLYILILTGIFDNMLGNLSSLLIFLLLISLLFKTLNIFLFKVIVGSSYFKEMNISLIFGAIINPLLLLLFIVILRTGILGVILSGLISNFISTILFYYFIRKKNRFDISFNLVYIIKSFKYGIKVWFGDIAVVTNLRFDQLITGILLTSKDLGYYSIAVTISELLWYIPDSLAPILFNKISKTDKGESSILVNRINRLLLPINIIATILLGILGYYLIPIFYGEQFEMSSSLFLILLPGTLLYITPKILTKYFSGIGEPEKSSYIQIICSVFSVLFILALIKSYGILSSPIASTISYSLAALFSIYLYRRSSKSLFKDLLVIKKEDIVWIKNLVFSKK